MTVNLFCVISCSLLRAVSFYVLDDWTDRKPSQVSPHSRIAEKGMSVLLCKKSDSFS